MSEFSLTSIRLLSEIAWLYRGGIRRGIAMFPEPIEREQFVDLQPAFAMASLELGLGYNEAERHRLADFMVSLAKDGQTDPDVIRVMAVHRMQPPEGASFRAA